MSSVSRVQRACLTVLGCGLISFASTGCQSTIGGQTLPSAYYLRDDVQYYQAGPEFKLSRQVEALEEYKLRQAGLDQVGSSVP